tara:strand:- start:27 stop:1370 length:1344 start_codon:yes stop_codon:yes gene_type:complete
MNIHFIAIGGAVMHNMAICLSKSNNVSGSDDQIYEPSKSRLQKNNLLPEKLGWDKARITNKIDCVILGMHAKSDNPELLEARKKNIPIYSFPEYITKHSTDKFKIVIAGSHGKTSITSMIMHVLKSMKIDFDYMVGANIKGFDNMFKLTKKNKIIILEGDEYLSSSIDPTPKFHKYEPDIAVISGISWDHINVFKTFESYIQQFKLFIEMVKHTLIYFEDDHNLKNLVLESKSNAKFITYGTPNHKILNNKTIFRGKELKIFGCHNMQNLKAAMEVCKILKIDEKSFLKNISNFEGAERRLEIVKKINSSILFRDFAHSPSKLKATINAVKKQFKKRRLIACMELNTFSSLNKVFLSEYKNCMDEADIAIIYYNPKNIQAKKLEKISDFDIIKAFSNKNINIFNNSAELEKFIRTHEFTNTNLLMMSSGNFDNIKIENLINYSFKFN